MPPINGRELVKGLGMMEAALQSCVVSNNVLWDRQGNFAAKPGAEGSQPGPVDKLEHTQSFRIGWYFLTNSSAKQFRRPSRNVTADSPLKYRPFSTA